MLLGIRAAIGAIGAPDVGNMRVSTAVVGGVYILYDIAPGSNTLVIRGGFPIEEYGVNALPVLIVVD